MEKVTLIGTGRMGNAISCCLLKQNIPLTVYNRTTHKTDNLKAQGAIVANSIKEAVAQADIIISCLSDDDISKQMCLDEHGIARNMPETAIHIGTATILPKTATFLADAHREFNRHYVSAAVLGGPDIAASGKLTTFYANHSADGDRIQNILNLFSAQAIELGPKPDAPLIMKITMNYSLLTALELISEVYTFAEKSGLDLDIVQEGLYQIYGHPGFQAYIDKIKTRSFDKVNFDLRAGMKDVSIFQEAFEDVGVVPKLANLVKERYIVAKAKHLSEKDWSAIYEVVRDEAGLS